MGDVSADDTGCVTIKVSGDFSFALNSAFQQALQQYPKGKCRFAIDLSEVHELDSSALGMMLQLREHGREGEKVQLLNLQDAVRRRLSEADFSNLFTLVES
jgi:anti-anti-sigma factor